MGAPAPFSEPRGWTDCPECRGGHYDRWAEGSPLAPCSECGQPPRCRAGSKNDHRCPRPATSLSGTEPFLCGQHQRFSDLSHDVEEWELAGEQLGHFRKLAETLCNWALLEALDLAWAECEMRAEGARNERRMIFREGGGY